MSTLRNESLLDLIRSSVIGADEAIETPFGARRITYADYTASGRSLSFLEAFIEREVLPLYANTHTETSGTGRQTTRFREEARAIIKAAAGAGPEDALIFCGSGATGAVHTLIEVLNLCLPDELDSRYKLRDRVPADERPVVFIGPYEHHSNELPWRESIADVVVIHEDANGRIDVDELEERLVEFADRPLRIGSFSAASNVTGVLTDAGTISRLLHHHGALSFWDYAAAAPYVDIAMNGGSDDPDDSKDAVFLSPHKFVGGPGTPGVLLAKRHLFHNRVPSRPGGGTVDFVTETSHRYSEDPELREEGGTPAIIESIRAGLVFQLKEAVGVDVIRAREEELTRRAIDAWERNPSLEVLGPHDAERLAILSFTVRFGDGYLHHDLVTALLNDLFGIQARGGCSCAGPYGARLLGIDGPRIEAHVRKIEEGCRGLKPGWTRVGFNYFVSDREADFLLRAVDWVATHGWKLLPWYDFDAATGEWRHRDWAAHAPMSLHDVRYDDGRMRFTARHTHADESALDSYFQEAEEIRQRAESELADLRIEPAALEPDFEQMRWFPLAHDVVERFTGTGAPSPAR